MMMQNSLFFVAFQARGALGGLKLDEIDATNSFLMLPMARYSLKWPFKGHFDIIFYMICTFSGRPEASEGLNWMKLMLRTHF